MALSWMPSIRCFNHCVMDFWSTAYTSYIIYVTVSPILMLALQVIYFIAGLIKPIL